MSLRPRLALSSIGTLALVLALPGCPPPAQSAPMGDPCVDALGVRRLDGCYGYRSCGAASPDGDPRMQICTCVDGALEQCGTCAEVGDGTGSRPSRPDPTYCGGAFAADASTPSADGGAPSVPERPQYTEARPPEDPCEDPRTDAARARCLFEADWGTTVASDVTDDLLVAGPPRVDFLACRDGVLYASYGAVTAMGVTVMWGGAILEPTPGGEVAASLASAPAAGFLGGTVAVKVSGGWDRCVLPLAQVAWTAAANGAEWAARGIRELILSFARTSICSACPAPRTPECRQDCTPPSAVHRPCTGDHRHRYVYQMHQNPVTCECFERRRDDVTCNDGACSAYRGAGRTTPHNLGTYACP